MIKAAADAEIAQGNFQPDGKDGAMSVKLDFAPKQTGWSDGQPTTKLIVRIRKNGTWHCFPSP
jgi:hypothetical protein